MTRNKYRAIRVKTPDGLSFDSKGEFRRWCQLRLLEDQGVISNLQRQVSFKLVVNGVLVATYRADFVYQDSDGRRVVEDFKSPPTRKEASFRLKEKLMKACHGITLALYP